MLSSGAARSPPDFYLPHMKLTLFCFFSGLTFCHHSPTAFFSDPADRSRAYPTPPSLDFFAPRRDLSVGIFIVAPTLPPPPCRFHNPFNRHGFCPDNEPRTSLPLFPFPFISPFALYLFEPSSSPPPEPETQKRCLKFIQFFS